MSQRLGDCSKLSQTSSWDTCGECFACGRVRSIAERIKSGGRGEDGRGGEWRGVVGGESPLNVLITTGAKLLQGLGKV